MSSRLDEPTRTSSAPPSQTTTRPFLYDNDADVPDGWELTEPARSSTVRLAFDPKRNTVVHDLGGPTPHASIVEALRGAGFESYLPAGAESSFLVRDRTQSSQVPRPTPAASSGLAR